MGANRFASLRTEKVRRVKVPDRKFFFGWPTAVRVSRCGGRTGPRKGWGGGGKEKEKDIPKNDGRGEKYPFRENLIVWDPQNLRKKKKSEKVGGGGLVRENGCSHTHSIKKLKFFFEIFMLGNFTLRTFPVHMEVN